MSTVVNYDQFVHIQQLREQGKSWRQIEKIIGKDKSWLHRYYKKEQAKRFSSVSVTMKPVAQHQTYRKSKPKSNFNFNSKSKAETMPGRNTKYKYKYEHKHTPTTPSQDFLTPPISLSRPHPMEKSLLRTQNRLPPGIAANNINVNINYESEDTRTWSWARYAQYFFEIELLPHQVEDLKAIEENPRLILNDPRRHGKTFIVEFVFVLRKLCESVYHEVDENIIFISAVSTVVEIFSLDVQHELEYNLQILGFYGALIDDDAKNTTLIIIWSHGKT